MSRRLVTILGAEAISQSQICVALGVDGKTLQLYYRRELDKGSAMVEAKLVGNLLLIAERNNAVALKAIMFVLQCRFGWSPFVPAPRG